uniref:Aminoglycoside phosphotransferase n=1 Tax=Cereibacter sphaeroides (strain ATCC 17025 / ATH 2.4.3) TaxID=349102 RepID=A4WWS6_CERS5
MDDAAPATREALAQAFLARSGWGTALRHHLAGDASDRSYQRLQRGPETAVLMDAPPGRGDDPAAFVAIAAHLRRLGLSAPEVLACDLENGFLLLEDLGDALFARLLSGAGGPAESALYEAATDVLIHLQRAAPPAGLPDLSATEWAQAAAMAPDWYARAATGTAPDAARFTTLLEEALRRHADGPRVLILRDYHAENLLWLPARTGLAQVGLLDFQLAQMGQPGYDLVSLVQDARRDVPEAMEHAMIRRFAAATRAEPEAFDAAHAVLGAQRALRILGIFARLCLVAGKPGYVALIPRVWGQLWRNLAHPALAPLAAECRALLPEPAPAVLERIRAQCGQMR